MISATQLLESLTEQNVLQLLQEFNLQPAMTKPNEYWFETKCHYGDSHKLCMFRDSLTFYCYTNCGKMNIFDLVMKLRCCSFGVAVSWVAQQVGISTRCGFGRAIARTELHVPEKYLRRRKQQKKTIDTTVTTYNTKTLNYFEPDIFCGSWLDEGIAPEVMLEFGIAWYELQQAVIIPHYDIDGNLIGIRRRSFLEDELALGRKYMPLILEQTLYSHPLGNHLYGLYQSKQAIMRYKRIIVVESEKSVLLSKTYYGSDSCAVASCGFNITEAQKKLILTCGVEEVVLGFDKDYEPLAYDECEEADLQEYHRFMNRIQSLAEKFANYCRVYVLWDNMSLLQLKDSPFDRGRDTFETLMKNKVEITTKTKE